MRRILTAALATAALLTTAGCAPGAGGSSSTRKTVEIRAYIPTSASPYSITTIASDQNTGQTIHNKTETVARAEYGPALVIYDSGHGVKIEVEIEASKDIPSSAFLRVWDGPTNRKSAGPAGATRLLRVTLYTNR